MSPNETTVKESGGDGPPPPPPYSVATATPVVIAPSPPQHWHRPLGAGEVFITVSDSHLKPPDNAGLSDPDYANDLEDLLTSSDGSENGQPRTNNRWFIISRVRDLGRSVLALFHRGPARAEQRGNSATSRNVTVRTLTVSSGGIPTGNSGVSPDGVTRTRQSVRLPPKAVSAAGDFFFSLTSFAVLFILAFLVCLTTFRVVLDGCQGWAVCSHFHSGKENMRGQAGVSRLFATSSHEKVNNCTFRRFIPQGRYFPMEVVHDLGTEWSALIEWRNGGPRCLLFDMRPYSYASNVGSTCPPIYPSSLDERVGVPASGSALSLTYVRRFVRHFYTPVILTLLGESDASIRRNLGDAIVGRCMRAHTYTVFKVETRMDTVSCRSASKTVIDRLMELSDPGYRSNSTSLVASDRDPRTVVIYDNNMKGGLDVLLAEKQINLRMRNKKKFGGIKEIQSADKDTESVNQTTVGREQDVERTLQEKDKKSINLTEGGNGDGVSRLVPSEGSGKDKKNANTGESSTVKVTNDGKSEKSPAEGEKPGQTVIKNESNLLERLVQTTESDTLGTSIPIDQEEKHGKEDSKNLPKQTENVGRKDDKATDKTVASKKPRGKLTTESPDMPLPNESGIIHGANDEMIESNFKPSSLQSDKKRNKRRVAVTPGRVQTPERAHTGRRVHNPAKKGPADAVSKFELKVETRRYFLWKGHILRVCRIKHFP